MDMEYDLKSESARRLSTSKIKKAEYCISMLKLGKCSCSRLDSVPIIYPELNIPDHRETDIME